MSISFNQVPSNARVPFLFAEFDSSKAQQGPSIQPYEALMLAIKSSGGSATADVPVGPVTSEAQAITLFGRGSMAHLMARKFLLGNKFTALTVVPQDENAAGVKATGTLTITGPATASGTIYLLIGGQAVQVAVTSGDAQNTISAAISAAINLALDLPVVATVLTNVVTLTARHKSLLGNGIDLRVNYNVGEALPTGVGISIVAMSGGTTAPVLTTSIAALPEKQYNIVCMPYNDATSLTALETELADRFGPIRQIDGLAIAAKDDTLGNLTTFGPTRNSKHVSCLGIYKSPTPSFEIAASAAGIVAYYAQQDPARPFQTLVLPGVLAPSESDQFVLSERNGLLFDGIATLKVNPGNTVAIERLITMYQLNGAGAADTAYLDATTLLTLSYLRYDWRNHMLSKYPRHKLANDGTRYGAGQAIITPKVGKAEAIVKFRQWEELGLVEGFDQFKRDLVVERNVSDVNRLDFLLPPDLVNSLIVMGTQIGFLL